MISTSGKIRADILLVERGLAASRAKAQALLLAGQVWSGTERIEKAGQLLASDAPLRLAQQERFVSRGGYKLEGALKALELDVRGLVCVDVGASTGGFCDCLLQSGAAKVYAVDVGENQLDARLRSDARVVVMDRTNARYLEPTHFAEPLELAVVDASFIGIEKLLPALARILPSGARLLALIKPQFEAGRREATRARGVIRDAALRNELIERARAQVAEQGFDVLGGVDSVLAGPKGNLEYFVLARRSSGSALDAHSTITHKS
ncbi:MAG: TlyA family RNA methyltransferase [Myxococcota bacterium]